MKNILALAKKMELIYIFNVLNMMIQTIKLIIINAIMVKMIELIKNIVYH
jgi:hypothetical protein